MCMFALLTVRTKFWLEPEVELAKNHGLSQVQLKELDKIVEEKADEICKHWDKYFGT